MLLVSFFFPLSAPVNLYHNRLAAEKQSHCQIELDLFVDDLIVHQPFGMWQGLAPVRILSFGEFIFCSLGLLVV